MKEQYTVINASAGSGKTYTLVQRLLTLCLQNPNQPDAIKHILALTFTNKAANEMKRRILEWLKAFSDPNSYQQNKDLENIHQKLKTQGIHIGIDQLHERSKKVLDFVLHHYSTLNIGTIDKFNSRLVRSFSYELGLAQNFNLEIQADPFINEAVDKMLDEVGTNETISDAFMDFVNYSLDNNERVNLNQALYNSAKEFVQDKHYFQLTDNKDFTWNSYEKSKQKLRKDIQDLKQENIGIVTSCIELMQEKNLEIADFAGGNTNGIAKFFSKMEEFYQGNIVKFPFPTNEEGALKTFLKGSSTTGKKREDEILEILDFLLERRRKIIHNYIISQKKEKILRAILPLKVNKEIQDKLAEIETENDLVLLSKFNVMIHENLRDEPSSFIYEKVGTQFSHYFFDEFQDTSQLQWQNFLPLRDHTISSENTTFTLVGDPKQSIYRFRGGDSTMMLNIIQGKENAPIKAHVELLDTNWRSSKNIVDFNNKYYNFLSHHVHEEHADIFGKDAQQKANADYEGRVKINLIEQATRTIYYEEIAAKMIENIQECLQNGFSFSDITILCRDNTDIFKFSQLLGGKKIIKNGTEIAIKTISDKGLTLELSPTILATIAFLRWKQNPKNQQFLVKMMYQLQNSGRITISDFSKEMLTIIEIKNQADQERFIQDEYGIKLMQTEIPHLNLYNYIEYYIQEFSVIGAETDYLLNFLEMLYNFSQNSVFTLKDFLKYWDEEAHEISIQTSESIDAIQIMTIHKAKGLEFPVVFIPLQNSNKDGKFSGWISAEDDEVSSVIVSPFSKDLEIYDEGMLAFNQEHIYQNKIDRFCLQYVATTRAVEQMFLYIEKPTSKTNYLELFDFVTQRQHTLFASEEEKPDSFDFFEIDEEKVKKQKKIKNQNSDTQTQKIETLERLHEKVGEIKIATPSKNYQERIKTVREGIFTHEILSKIKTENDIELVLESYVLEGTITVTEKENILQRIKSVITDPKYQPFFTDGLKVFNEQEIMINDPSQREVYRPDRLIETENGWIIIDFKTGKETEKYEKQIANYKAALEKTGRKVIQTELIYL